MKTFEHNCLACGQHVGSARRLDGSEYTPKPGDFSICDECGNLAIIGEDMMLHPLAKEDRELFMADADAMISYGLVLAYKQLKLSNRKH